MTASLLASATAAAVLSCAPTPGGSAAPQENHAMIAPSASRPAPPIVAPVEQGGVRYLEAAINERDGDQAGGYLAAIDVASSRQLWRLKVYDVPDYRAAGIDGNSRHFSNLELSEGGTALVVTNEAGGRYHVDLAARTVVQIGGPPEEAPPAVVVPKPKPQP